MVYLATSVKWSSTQYVLHCNFINSQTGHLGLLLHHVRHNNGRSAVGLEEQYNFCHWNKSKVFFISVSDQNADVQQV